MIVVVADTSPLNYLVQIECQNLLPALYERISVPEEVVRERSHPRTPAAVRAPHMLKGRLHPDNKRRDVGATRATAGFALRRPRASAVRRRGGSRTAPTRDADDRAAEELSKVVGLDARTESPAEENAAETSKSPEQSENVIENKGPAADGVSA
jgi:hypothetical protein